MDGKKTNYLAFRLGAFEEKHLAVLKGETFRVFVFLAGMANVHHKPVEVAEIGRNQLSRLLGVGVNTVTRALAALVAGDYIEVHPMGYRVKKLLPNRIQNGSSAGGSKTDPVDPKQIQAGSETDPVNAATALSDNELGARNCVTGEDRGETPLSPPPPPPPDLVLKQEKSKSASTKKLSTKAKPKKKKPHPTVGKLEWDPVKLEFGKGRQELRDALSERYLKSHGDEWITTVYRGMREKLIWEPEMIQEKESQWMFVLGWYQRQAQDKANHEAGWKNK